MDGQLLERAVGQHMGDIAEGVLVHVEAGVGGDVDLPFRDRLAVVAAGRHAQDLDDAGGRRLVAVAGGMGNSQAHEVSLALRHSGAMRSIELWGALAPLRISRFRVWSFGPSRNDGILVRSNTAW